MLPPSSRLVRALPVALPIGAIACDPAAVPLRHPSINEGLFPTGGGWGDAYAYEYEGLSAFPIRGRWYGNAVEYSGRCPP